MSPQESRPEFRRVLRLGGLVLFGITFVTPIAPFPMFGIISSVSRGHMALAYLFAMTVMTLTAISYGRMASAFPAAGSAYTYVRKSVHPLAGFFVGWVMLLDYVLIPLICVIYMSLTASRLAPAVPYSVWLICFSVAIGVINLLGLKVANRANFVMTAIMSLTVLWFALSATLALQSGLGEGTLLSVKPFYNPPEFSFGAVMAATSIAIFSYLGFDGISTLAEDSHNPRKNIGRATILVCLISGSIFIIQTYLGQLIWPDFTSYPSTETAFMDISRLAGGDQLFWMATFVLMVAGLASSVTGQASASRLLFGMGRDRLLPPRIFAYVHPKYSTPTYGILSMTVVTIIGGFFVTFQVAAEAIDFGALIGFMGVNLSVFSHYYLKRSRRRPGAIVFDVFLPALGFLVCLYVFVSLGRTAKIIGSVWCLAGVVRAFVLTKGFRRGLEMTAPETGSFDESLDA